MSRDEWLRKRLGGIGASEAAAIMGMSPYMSNEELWEIKTRRRKQEDISSKPYVEYGTRAEQHIRALFALDHPQYVVEYDEFEMIHNPRYPFIFATLDGKLLEMDDSTPMQMILRRGVLEIKTTEIKRSTQWEQWNQQVPNHYYIQLLHQLLATGWDFACLVAQIKWWKDGELQKTVRHYPIERAAVVGDLELLLQEEIKFWDWVQQDRRPGLKLPQI